MYSQLITLVMSHGSILNTIRNLSFRSYPASPCKRAENVSGV